MPRPKRADPPVRLEIALPESLHARASMLLFSGAEGRIPHGAWSAFIASLVRQALDRIPQTQGAEHGNVT